MRTIKGVTLIEMVIVMTILGIVMATSSQLLVVGFQGYFTGVSITSLDQKATLAMARMSKELEKAVAFTALGASNVAFTTTQGSVITYTLSGSTLTRQVGAGTAQTLTDAVSVFSLNYYYPNNFNAAPTTPVKAITISLTLAKGSQTLPLINTVFLSNMQ